MNSKPKTVTVAQMRKIEAKAEEVGFSKSLMMENAGRAIAEIANILFEPQTNPKVLAVCGPGNNGGDCVAAARHLSVHASVDSILLGKVKDVRTEEAKLQWRIATESNMTIYEIEQPSQLKRLQKLFLEADIILDGIFGTGVKPPISEPFYSAVKLINNSLALKIAIDVPSGLDPDTGDDCGIMVLPDITVVLHALKPGLLKKREQCGTLMVKDIGIPQMKGNSM